MVHSGLVTVERHYSTWAWKDKRRGQYQNAERQKVLVLSRGMQPGHHDVTDCEWRNNTPNSLSFCWCGTPRWSNEMRTREQGHTDKPMRLNKLENAGKGLWKGKGSCSTQNPSAPSPLQWAQWKRHRFRAAWRAQLHTWRTAVLRVAGSIHYVGCHV